MAGTDLTGYLKWDGKTAEISDYDMYLSVSNPRMKKVMAFDNLEMTDNFCGKIWEILGDES